MTWWEPLRTLFQIGGPMMAPLLLVSVWLWMAILAKFRWVWAARGEKLAAGEVRVWLTSGAPREEELGSFKGRALRDFLDRRTGEAGRDLRLWRAAVQKVRPQLGRHLAVIVVLAGTAPLLGLLGTVGGMISTFDAISRFGTGNAQAMAAGISEALITTQAGLLVAIPGLLAGHYLRRQAKKEGQRLIAFQQMVERWLVSRERVNVALA
ncbi:MAG: MotA/TolQ/ExbB proton channel family protein [Deltaproteobacteria bacterium]|nr:MotA/TolQ/ExbB proton channel family protein [Deltaproteobacteria bacterium]